MYTLARILLAALAVFTLVGAFIADAVGPMAQQHIFNPNWSPHAKFHDAQYIVMSVLIGAISLTLLWRNRALLICAAILSTPWLGMFGALLFPGTSMRDPEFDVPSAYVLGTHPQVIMATSALAVVLVAVLLARCGGGRSVVGPRETPSGREQLDLRAGGDQTLGGIQDLDDVRTVAGDGGDSDQRASM